MPELKIRGDKRHDKVVAALLRRGGQISCRTGKAGVYIFSVAPAHLDHLVAEGLLRPNRHPMYRKGIRQAPKCEMVLRVLWRVMEENRSLLEEGEGLASHVKTCHACKRMISRMKGLVQLAGR